MRQSVQKLEQFYVSRLGVAAQAMVSRRLQTLWPDLDGLDVLGYGYGIPFLQGYGDNISTKCVRSIVYAMPAEQGAVRQMSSRGNISVLTPDHQFPFEPGVFDRVLLVHGLEEAPRMAALLGELWRVMKPEGRIVIVAANRAGLWARTDKTPFGAGRPFSRTQLSMALKTSGFVPLVRSGALYCPPMNKMCSMGMAAGFEKFGETVWPGFSGLVLVEAVKRLYAGQEGRERRRIKRPNFSGAGVLGASSGTSTGTSRDMHLQKGAD